MKKNISKNNIDSRRTFWQTIRRFFAPCLEESGFFLKVIFVEAFLACYLIITILIIKYITTSLELGNKEYLSRVVLFFVVLSLLYFFVKRKTKYLRRNDLGHILIKILQRKYLKKFVILDATQIEIVGTGKMINILYGGITKRRQLLRGSIRSIIETFFTLVFCFFMIFYYFSWFGFVFLVLFISIFFFVKNFDKKAHQYRKEKKEANIDHTRLFVKVIMSKNDIMQNGKISNELAELDKTVDVMNDKACGVVFYWQIIALVPGIITTLLRILVFVYAIWGVVGLDFSFSTFVVLISLLGMFESNTTASLDVYSSFVGSFVDIEKLRDTFDRIPTMEGYNTGAEFEYKKGDMELKNIDFSYGESKVFDDFSLHIQGGKMTAFVGESGGGKSTLIKLLAGYIKSDRGKVIVDGQYLYNNKGQITNDANVSLQSYYKHIGYLTQDPSVFDGTVRENLMYGIEKSDRSEKGQINNKRQIDDTVGLCACSDCENDVDENGMGKPNSLRETKIDNIIRLSKCEFIYDLPNGLDTEIGERGVRLSGGQKQRLAIAKIMLKNPDIILLDEPTSALDSFNEEQVSIALHNLFKGKTVVVIAHRLQTVKQADIIHYLDKGKIIESGTHQDLIAKNGKYKRMLDLQSGF